MQLRSTCVYGDNPLHFVAKRGKKSETVPPVKFIQHIIRSNRYSHKKGIRYTNKPIHRRTAIEYQKTIEALELCRKLENEMKDFF